MLATVAQYADDSSGGGIVAGGLILVYIAILVVVVVSLWKIFEKMGDPGWMGIIPFFNYYRVFQRSRPDQAIIWTIVAVFCCIGTLLGQFDLARLFGKEIGFTLGVIFLPFIFLPILAFGSAQYVGPPPPQVA